MDIKVTEVKRVVIKKATYILAHTPDLVRYGSKPERELEMDDKLLPLVEKHLRSFEDAVAYPPNQVFIGNLTPQELAELQEPWHSNLLASADRFGKFGEIMPQDEFYGLLKIWDQFKLVWLEKDFTVALKIRLASHPLLEETDLQKLGEGVERAKIEEKTASEKSLPLFHQQKLVGCVHRAHDQDATLTAEVMVENLSTKVTGVLASRHLLASLAGSEGVDPSEIDYFLSCSEEAVGDRYNRGGGNMAKAIGEECHCLNASGCDLKSFCAGVVLSIVHGAALIKAGLYKKIVVVGGGSFSKLGMKFQGHLKKDMPILEDILGGIAVLLTADDGSSPAVNLIGSGKHDISAGATAQEIYRVLLIEPLERLQKKIKDVDKYAVELHNPEVTVPMGSGNVPLVNYRTIAAMAAMRGEIEKKELKDFVASRGMVGFSPTQGHIASAVPFLGHALKMITDGEINNTFFAAKGSLFLGRMTHLADGVSFLLEKNPGTSD